MSALAALSQTSDPTGGLLSYGVLGIVVVAFITGLLVPGYLYRRLDAENERLRKLVEERVFPALEAGTAATREATEVLREVLRLLPILEQLPRQRKREP